MNIPWDELELFLAVAEERSFSAAARRLAVSQPTVSRRVGAMEERLQRPLFHRGVDGTELTPEGAKLYPAAAQMARFAQELHQIAVDFDDQPAGVVRVAMPPGIAHDFFVPFARHLQQSLPDIRLHAIAGVEHIDLLRGGAELALRSQRPGQPELTVLAHARVSVGVFACPRYLAQFARTPKLEQLDWITWAYPNEHLEPTPTLNRLIANFAPRFASNDFNVQVRAAAEGLGAMFLSCTTHEHSLHKSLVRVPVDIALPRYDYFLVCAKALRWAPRVQAVATRLVQAMGEVEGLDVVQASV